MFWLCNPLLSAVYAAPPCGTCSRARDIPVSNAAGEPYMRQFPFVPLASQMVCRSLQVKTISGFKPLIPCTSSWPGLHLSVTEGTSCSCARTRTALGSGPPQRSNALHICALTASPLTTVLSGGLGRSELRSHLAMMFSPACDARALVNLLHISMSPGASPHPVSLLPLRLPIRRLWPPPLPTTWPCISCAVAGSPPKLCPGLTACCLLVVRPPAISLLPQSSQRLCPSTARSCWCEAPRALLLPRLAPPWGA